MCYDYNVEVEELLAQEDDWSDWESEEDEEFDEYPGDCDDWDIEMGFDPYEGCYTWDC